MASEDTTIMLVQLHSIYIYIWILLLSGKLKFVAFLCCKSTKQLEECLSACKSLVKATCPFHCCSSVLRCCCRINWTWTQSVNQFTIRWSKGNNHTHLKCQKWPKKGMKERGKKADRGIERVWERETVMMWRVAESYRDRPERKWGEANGPFRPLLRWHTCTRSTYIHTYVWMCVHLYGCDCAWLPCMYFLFNQFICK